MSGLFLLVSAVLVIFSSYFIVVYNQLVFLKNRVETAWSQIEVQIKRRHDLIPNLVEVAKGYLSHEKDTLERVIQARTQAIQAKSISGIKEAENILTSALKSLFAVVEQYPDLKANENMLRLHEEITSTENRIAYARQFYNEEVRQYNTYLEKFPMNVIASLFKFSPKEFFDIDTSQEKVPEVKF